MEEKEMLSDITREQGKEPLVFGKNSDVEVKRTKQGTVKYTEEWKAS